MSSSEQFGELSTTNGCRRALLWSVIGVAAIAARIVPWRTVFTSDGVRFLSDGDPYYHVLRAQRIAERVPNAAWQDPGLEHPLGAAIPWPPLLDEIFAWMASVVAVGNPTAQAVNVVAAMAPVVLGVATVAVAARLATQLWDRGAAPGAALLLALAPIHVSVSVVGRPDHHVVEVLLACVALAAWVEGWRSGFRAVRFVAGTIAAGVALSAAFWVWPGSALDLALLASISATAYVLLPESDGAPRRMAVALAGASGTAAVVLAITMSAFGAPGALRIISLTGLSSFHVLLCAAGAAFGVILVIARRPIAATARLLVALGAAAAASALLAPSSGMRAEIARALAAVGTTNPWYAAIGEFQPLLFSGVSPLTTELWNTLGWFGAIPIFVCFGGLELRDRWRARPQDRAIIVTLAAWTCISSVLALARMRFGPYIAAPIAILAWLGIERGLRSLPGLASGGWGITSRGLAVGATCAGLMGIWRADMATAGNRAAPVLTWLSQQGEPPAARYGVLADWALGHHVQYFAHRPVIASPFGTELGGRGFEDMAAFFITTNESRAEEVLDRRSVGYVLASDPWSTAGAVPAFAARGDEPVGEVKRSWRTGTTFSPGPSYASSMGNRLHRLDGGPPGGAGSFLSRLRLLRETEPRDGAVEFKLYGVVTGASLLVSGAVPGTEVSVSTQVRTHTGRAFTWKALASSAPDGQVEVRVPYATGMNGSSIAEEYVVSAGALRTAVTVSEYAVTTGATIPVPLRGLEPRRSEQGDQGPRTAGYRVGAPQFVTPAALRGIPSTPD